MVATAVQTKRGSKAPKVSKEWRDLLCSLPGFDPFRHPGDSWFDPARAERAIGFIEEMLTHVEGALAKRPFKLNRWQKASIANLFGWVRRLPMTHIAAPGAIVRRFREMLLYIARKNGKTPLVAAIANCVMFLDGEMGAQGYLLAGEKEQAGLLFRQVKGQIENDEALLARATVYGGDAGTQRRIVYRETNGFLVVQSADAETKHGGTSHFVAIDELHVQPDRDLVDALRTSFASENRVQPLFVMLTTADFDRPSICNEVYDYACKVRDGVIEDPAFLPVIFEADRNDDWKDPRVWAKANPNLNISVNLEYLQRECRRAQEQPAYENTFKRLHCNMRTEQDVRIIPLDAWDKCTQKIDLQTFRGQRCYGGLDLSSREDLSSFTLLFPGNKPALITFSWCPEDRVRSRAKKRVPYDVWARDERFLIATAGNRIDHRAIREKIVELGQMFTIEEIGYDPREATEIVQNLQDADGFTMVEVSQNFGSMSAPTKDLISRVKSEQIIVQENPVLRWAASNTAVHFTGRVPVGENIDEFLDKIPIMPSKQRSADKIDPITSAVIAMNRLSAHPDAAFENPYETGGVRFI